MSKSLSRWRARPEIREATDAVVRMVRTPHSHVHQAASHLNIGRPSGMLGLQGIGIVESVGAAVTALSPTDLVLVACISACGRCAFCLKGLYSYCTTGGWIVADGGPGMAANRVRIPHADTSLTRLSADGVTAHATALLTHLSILDRICDAYDRCSIGSAPDLGPWGSVTGE